MTSPSPSAPRANLPLVLFWMGGALISFSVIAVSLRELSKTLGVFDMLALRNGSSLVVLGAIMLVRPRRATEIRPHRFSLHLLRNAASFGGAWAWAYAVTVLPLALVFALEFTAPLWVTVFAVLFLGERLTQARLICVALGFLGVLVITRPGVGAIDPRALLPLAAAIGFATSMVVTKTVVRHDTTLCVLFWMNAMHFALNFALSSDGFIAKLPQAPLLPVLGVCIAGFFSHMSLTNAFRYGDAILVTPLDFLRVPLIAVVGWRLYGEPLDPAVLAGAALILAGIVWSLRGETRTAAAVSDGAR